jgi:lysine biosynthesis protein LysW
MTRCPECESDLELDGYELDVGENINCPECSIELKVTSVEPSVNVRVVREDEN